MACSLLAIVLDGSCEKVFMGVDEAITPHDRTGCIDPAEAPSRVRREAASNTSLGHGVVIPHGTNLIVLLQLGLRCGDAVTIPAGGDDESGALARICAAVTGLSAGEKAAATRRARSPPSARAPASPSARSMCSPPPRSPSRTRRSR